jgi:hypothetical protein
MSALADEIAAVLNRHSRENESDTPDFILADYLTNALLAFERAVVRREEWHGRPERMVTVRSRCSDSAADQDVAS